MTPAAADRAHHHRRRLTGRDPDEAHRSATPLELLYDLTFVVAFGTAADELAHYVADGHATSGIVGFVFATFAVSWAWINYSWFASAFDTDDWVCRLATMVQMVGVLLLALGLEQMFASVDHGDNLRNGVMVLGYVVMRVSLMFMWWQASRDDPERAHAALTYIWTLGVAQVGWVTLLVAELPVAATFVIAVLLLALELTGPLVAERRKGGTPWHAGHIAERYGLLVIITLGEAIIGTVATLNAVVHGAEGWTVGAALLAVAGVGLTFGSWWMYFAIPWAEILQAHRERAFGWSYAHLFVFGSLAGIGAGLHVAAYQLEGKAKIGATASVLSVAIPFAIYALALYAIYTAAMRQADPFHLILLGLTAAVLVGAVGVAAAGASMAVALVVLMFAPVVTVVGFEALGHRHLAQALERLRAK